MYYEIFDKIISKMLKYNKNTNHFNLFVFITKNIIFFYCTYIKKNFTTLFYNLKAALYNLISY